MVTGLSLEVTLHVQIVYFEFYQSLHIKTNVFAESLVNWNTAQK